MIKIMAINNLKNPPNLHVNYFKGSYSITCGKTRIRAKIMRAFFNI